ncbi:MAG: hypothetical protein DIZ80_01145 [endosymbiont of Galathealinum brachiosum]|uniref:DUF2846 domain-containing protein n=1 Tax=endosymbiont of Galathealinum brachiosum TaxID=2200906 RepID=A0A370DMH1_9GAMM|nr:MAG: hypothetical protein DIZ80_01145 [endosymbiont of Galathealinum brachiosum]
MKLVNLYILLIVAVFMQLSACGTTHYSKPDQDAQAKLFNKDPLKSGIYIYRPKVLNFNTEMAVEIDGKHAGNTEDATFIYQSLEPGEHVFAAHGEGTVEIKISTKPGENYYVKLDVRPGLIIPTPFLKQVDKKTGQSGVNECRLVE